MQPRFGGHLPVFYSVAEHCVQAAYTVWPEIRIDALLHDASEAYLIDVPRPVKNQLANYKEIEDNLMRVIANKYGFEWPLHEEVKRVDESRLQIEWDCLMLGKGDIEVWGQQQAKGRYLDLFHSLMGQRKKGNYPIEKTGKPIN